MSDEKLEDFFVKDGDVIDLRLRVTTDNVKDIAHMIYRSMRNGDDLVEGLCVDEIYFTNGHPKDKAKEQIEALCSKISVMYDDLESLKNNL